MTKENTNFGTPEGDGYVEADKFIGDIEATAGSIGTTELADNAITTAKITDANVTTAKIADDAVTSAKLDESTIQYTTVSISAAEIVALNATPKSIVAAPGAGKAIEFISAVLDYDYDTAAYTTNGDITFQTGTTGTALSDAVGGSDLLLGSADATRVCQALSADAQIDKNESLVLAVGTGDPVNPGSAAGTLVVKVAYRIHDFS